MKLRFGRLLAAALSLLCLAGCASPHTPAADGGYTFTDDLGREVTAAREPERVAALIGSFADIWRLAGGEDSLCAAAHDVWTSFGLEPGGSVADLGAVKEPNLEVLLASEPELVLASCNTAADLELVEPLTAAGIAVACFDVQSFADYLRMLEICTELTGRRENYEKYGLAVREEIASALSRADGSEPSVLVIRATGVSCKVKSSRDNVLGEMLAALGCRNIADSESALLEDLSLETIIAAEPDYIFAVLQGSESSRAMETLERTLLANPAWSGLKAVREGRFYTLEHELYNLKPNARWGFAYEKLAGILYPQ